MASEKVDTAKMKQLIIKYADKYGVPRDLALALVRQESGFNPKAKSPVGAMGLGQLMPGTAKDLGVTNAYDPEQNAEASMRYFGNFLKQYKGNAQLALAAYNAGPGRVQQYGGVPPFKETQNYVKSVMAGRKNYTANNNNNNQGTTLEGSVQKVAEGDNNNSNQSRTYMERPEIDYVTGPMTTIATTVPGPAGEMLNRFYRGQVSFDELNANFPDVVKQYKITPDMGRQSILSQSTVDMINRAEKALTPTDEQVQNLQQLGLQQNQQLMDAYNNAQQPLNDIMTNAYRERMNTIGEVPLINRNNTQQYIDPQQLQNALESDAMRARMDYYMGKRSSLPSDAELMMNIANGRYQAEQMNKYGAPYEVVVQQLNAEYANKVKAAQENVAYALSQYQAGNTSLQSLMKTIQDNNNAVNNYRNNANEQLANFYKAVTPDVVKGDIDLTKQEVQNRGSAVTSAMDNAAKIQAVNIGAVGSNVDTAMNANTSMRNADVNAYTMQRGQDVTRQTALDELNERQRQFDTTSPYTNLEHVGNAFTGFAFNPTVDPRGTTQVMLGLPDEQTNQMFKQPGENYGQINPNSLMGQMANWYNIRRNGVTNNGNNQ